jgi:hypothetical protein
MTDFFLIGIQFVILAILVFALLEIIFYNWIKSTRKEFPWLITSQDKKPILSKEGLKKFIPNGYDPELGWIRKPNTSGEEIEKLNKVSWHINEKGARTNPGFDELDSKISCFGDSFTFCRQVDDDKTWEHELSKLLKTNVQNFGVGNYGIDQSLLRMKREHKKNISKITVMAVVPDTISRIMSCWKHYYEYGNTFAFKPKFILEKNELHLIKNFVDDESKFDNYEKYLTQIKNYDFFYAQKFKKELLHFPYSITIFKNFSRNFTILWWMLIIKFKKKKNQDVSKIEWLPMKKIMEVNLQWRLKLFKNPLSVNLLLKIIEEYSSNCKKSKTIPVFAFLPQKDDLLFIKSNYNFYKDFLSKIKKIDNLIVIDVTPNLLQEENLDKLYSDNNEYGGHYSFDGNKKIATIFKKELSSIF